MPFEHLLQDVRYSCRVLARTPGFTAAAVLSLAMGIGANAAVFGFADAVLLRPLPVAHPDEMMAVGSVTAIPESDASSLVSSYPDYLDIRTRSRSFDGLAAFTYVTAGFSTTSGAAPELKEGMLASGNFFSVLGITPAIGRAFTAEEDRVPGRDPVVVLGFSLWEHEFASDPHVLGRHVEIDGKTFTVIGVAPSTFTGLNPVVRTDFFAPLMMSPWLVGDPGAASLRARDARTLTLIGRLAPGVSQRTAQAEVSVIGTNLARAYPETNKSCRFAVRTELQSRIDEDPPTAILVAMLAMLALAVLFVACANVAGLLASRAPVRAREVALRLAIGAGRSRVIGQLTTESMLIALLGAAAGVGVGRVGIALLRQIRIPADLPISLSIRVDHRVLIFSILLAVASAFLFGLSPAIRAARTDLTAVMKGSDPTGSTHRAGRARGLLVIAQIAISVVLLVAATFVYRAFQYRLANGPGYRTDHLLMATVDTSLVRYTAAQANGFFEDLTDRIRELPGVERVSLATGIPMSNDLDIETVVPEGFRFAIGQGTATVLASWVDQYYFPAMGLSVLSGRNFLAQDTLNAPLVAIVNQQFAHHYWPDQNPLGKRLRVVDGSSAASVMVVGVVSTSKYVSIAEGPTDFVYFPFRQKHIRRADLLIQSAGDAGGLAAAVRRAVRRLDPNLPVYNVRTMAEFYGTRATNTVSVLTWTIAGMGAVGLSLALIGLYGLVAYDASRRTREIGLRMAIGADRAAVLRMVLRQGVVLAAVGLVAGLAMGEGASALLRAAFVSGRSGSDLAAALIVSPVVLAVTLIAAYLPARRASRLDPMRALRHD